MQSGQYKEAISSFDKAIELDASRAELFINRGISSYSINQFTAAVADFDWAIQLFPDFTEAYYWRGLVLS
jgi:lipoprotein NlpI